jgi:putative membrane protein
MMWGYGFPGMMVFWGIICVAVIVGLYYLITQGGKSRSDISLDVLKKRYARGEINEEEFKKKRKDL